MGISDQLKQATAWLNGRQRVKLTQKIFFVQQLGVMIRTGISMTVALKTLAEQTSAKNFRAILTDLEQQVEKGNLLSKGLERYERTFGELFINMVRAGEASGKLEEVLKQLFVQMKKDHDIIAKVRGAMIYPLIVVVMMVAIGIMMMIYVVPSILSVFKELDVELPLATRIMIAVSDFVIAYGLYLVVAAIALGIGLVMLIRSPQGKVHFHQLLLRLPVAGAIIKKINLARFCRTLSSLLKTDIPIVSSFEITARILGNELYRRTLIEAKEKIKKGVGIHQALSTHQRFFPPVVLQMISVGEETGALDDILEESAIFYEDEVAQTMSDLPSLIEPILMVVLGIGVAAMAVAVLMPLYSLSEAI
ncbi:MAG: hypothetical protein A3J59_01120 [Candidatus Buchananbacteria bacterium RIFCSPHIGHO2_02_FULL_56_16]|uniref:Type II secretion system protein GspF domain-containing protein n=1 Tax=Candidatus Buchananbacteria bacterium RIFCSPHIGHO2_02_FULL_56_16 TaxID=1797542 RepID=A0A1G1YDL7_9BACT|nr:MAG: hypothetical protein A3J59_01120 [Candidatus Buchananbacteria bacterium RIFCSPHIGHO2_02_FULL_56_16]